jgi:hypothetical protein
MQQRMASDNGVRSPTMSDIPGIRPPSKQDGKGNPIILDSRSGRNKISDGDSKEVEILEQMYRLKSPMPSDSTLFNQ